MYGETEGIGRKHVKHLVPLYWKAKGWNSSIWWVKYWPIKVEKIGQGRRGKPGGKKLKCGWCIVIKLLDLIKDRKAKGVLSCAGIGSFRTFLWKISNDLA